MLSTKENKAYTERSANVSTLDTEPGQNVSTLDTQYSIDKNRLDKNSIEREKHAHGFFSNVFLTEDEIHKLSVEVPNYEDYIERLSRYIESSGKKYKSHYATILSWQKKDDAEKAKSTTAETPMQAPRRKSF